MSIVNNKWIKTNNNKLYRISDLTNFRYEQPHYCVELRASKKHTGEDVYIDWIACDCTPDDLGPIDSNHLIKKIIASEDLDPQ